MFKVLAHEGETTVSSYTIFNHITVGILIHTQISQLRLHQWDDPLTRFRFQKIIVNNFFSKVKKKVKQLFERKVGHETVNLFETFKCLFFLQNVRKTTEKFQMKNSNMYTCTYYPPIAIIAKCTLCSY